MNAYSPKGKRILGTLERLDGRAEVSENSWKREGGRLTFDFQGYTEIFWDGQRTAKRKGKTLFLDEDGNEWTAAEIVLKEEEEPNAR